MDKSAIAQHAWAEQRHHPTLDEASVIEKAKNVDILWIKAGILHCIRGKTTAPKQRLGTTVLDSWKPLLWQKNNVSIHVCNEDHYRMAQVMQWPHAIRNYIRRVRLEYQHVIANFQCLTASSNNTGKFCTCVFNKKARELPNKSASIF